MDMAHDRLFTIEEAAKALRISDPKFREIRKEYPKIFKPHLVGGRKVFTNHQLNKFFHTTCPDLQTENDSNKLIVTEAGEP